jgi:hypothetical protein
MTPTAPIAELSAALDVGATMAVGESGSDMVLRGRLVFLSAARGGSVLFGYRKYFGRDQVKTYASFDLQGTFRPVKTLGARAGFGVMYDFSPLLGVTPARATFATTVGVSVPRSSRASRQSSCPVAACPFILHVTCSSGRIFLERMVGVQAAASQSLHSRHHHAGARPNARLARRSSRGDRDHRQVLSRERVGPMTDGAPVGFWSDKPVDPFDKEPDDAAE